MSELATMTLAETALELISDDGEPLESDWHRVEMNLFIDLLRQAMAEAGRSDYFAGGNMFIYYSVEQARAITTLPRAKWRHFRGPDVFLVTGIEPVTREREWWAVWDEGGRYPNLIVELLSKSTAKIDRTTKKDIYERIFRTPDYIMYDRRSDRLEGFHLDNGVYQPIVPDPRGRMWLASVGMWIGRWQGEHKGTHTVWLRLFDSRGRLIPTPEEKEAAARAWAAAAEVRADEEKARADKEKARAAAAEAELARLRTKLAAGPGKARRRRT